ncbi:hypothetical protein ABIE56_001810 [Luteibacter sp. 621]|uniref:ArnT family glycosyltransferase n=1 Tax=Luteibacter sp. 621 TaxID=3373916 RepID=UPI003D2408DF
MTKSYTKIIAPLLFVIYLIIGVLVHADYGVSWDEPISRMNGLVNLKYVEGIFAPQLLDDGMKNVPDLGQWPDRDYGVAFELPLVALEKAFAVNDDDLYAFRHLIIFLFSSLGVLAIYKTARLVYGDYRLGMLAAAFLVLSPRFFAESFYNSKDIVFMASVAMAMYTFTRVILRPSVRSSLLHGAMTAVAIDIRIMGIMIVAATLGVLAAKAIKKEISWVHFIVCSIAYLAATVLVVYAIFPYLWADPIGHFSEALSNMAKFRWNSSVLYLGTVYQATALPWHYIPVWILITTPIVFTVCMVAGVIRCLRLLARNRFALWRSNTEMAELAYLALLVCPILAIMALHSVVYDGWRHLYFVYPAFVLVAIGGFAGLVRAKSVGMGWGRPLVLVVVGLSLLGNCYWIVRAHPLQNVYFNRLAGGDWKNRFELDYWGVGNWAALESILSRTDSQAITVKAISATPLDRALLSMPRKESDRFILSSPEAKTEYILDNYRFTGKADLSDYDLFYQRKVSGEKVVSIYRIRDESLADKVTRNDRAYTPEEFRQLSYQVQRRYKAGAQTYVDVRIGNASSNSVAVASSVGKPVRVSWRFLDASGRPTDGWNNRRDLPRDIPGHGGIIVKIPISNREEVPGGTLQIALLQEGVFWSHDVGMPPASFKWAADDSVE